MKINATAATQSAIDSANRSVDTAAAPDASAWVDANAGTGKTHVLTVRVLRLLLAGAPPERILCLTYTKAAAAEMSKRVFDTLAKWVIDDDARLNDRTEKNSLASILQRTPTDAEIALSRTLFARAIETPGGLKIQTIHAFAERLLQRFPLEADVTPGFKILDDSKGRELKARAIDATLTAATDAPQSALGKALSFVIRYAADTTFDDLLSKAIGERAWLEAASRIDLGASDDDFAAAETLLRRALDVPAGAMVDDLERQRASVLSDSDLRDLAELLNIGNTTDGKHADLLRQALSQNDAAARAKLLENWFMTTTGGARGRLLGADLQKTSPDLDATATAAQSLFLTITEQFHGLRLVTATSALYRLAGAVLQRYTAAKQTSGALDFDDLITRTTNLLTGKGVADWVLYKLDGGLGHILVDEAQDTSPAQWTIIEALAQEFFAGAGARDGRRTIFGVGDEKQSIYSFQGAAPEKFAEMGRRFAMLARDANTPWRGVPLTLSFRSVAPVLKAVDLVFADAAATPGLTATGAAIAHDAKRADQGGLVELWPVEESTDSEKADAWRPLDDATEQAPANRLAERIAETIDGWLRSGERLRSEDRPVRPGDILILVRKRHPFAVPMVAALKKRGIPVAGADRMTLTDQIAVQDLMALGDFLTLPEDDLALASVLKGPIFDFDDDDLLSIAHGRKGALWKALLAHANAGDGAKVVRAAETLKRWRAKADFTPPFEFFSGVLDRDGARTRLLHRLGPEAADAIDEFLDLALDYDENEPPSLAGFLANLRAEDRDVKRDMDLARDEVRVMTVHGAKGLEAPIVFLPDTCTTASGDSPGSRLLKLPGVERPSNLPDPLLWAVKGTSRLTAVQRASNAKNGRDTEERNRLLYVAMTRARDRLYIAGFAGKKARPDDCWHTIIDEKLRPVMAEIDVGDVRKIHRMEAEQVAPPEKPKDDAQRGVAPLEPPDFARRRAPAEPQLSVPLAPSRLEPYAPDAEGEPVVPRSGGDPAIARDAPSPLATADSRRFLRGTLTHALLQHLPEIAPAQRESAAAAFVETRGATLSAAVRKSIVKETMAVLSTKDFAALFGPGSRSEVAISASLPRPRGAGPALRLSGQIDRLAVTADSVLIIDYKTNRPPPHDVAGVADAYLFQLAAYILALREIYPGKSVRAALLWTDGPRLMELPAKVIDDAISRLWNLDFASLDAP
ncbi:MAG: double-strand break repair helicase AddA [Hyphomicrobium sp.]